MRDTGFYYLTFHIPYINETALPFRLTAEIEVILQRFREKEEGGASTGKAMLIHTKTLWSHMDPLPHGWGAARTGTQT